MHHLIISQVKFVESDTGLLTARNIIAHKIRNQRGVLERYRQSLTRAEQYSALRQLNHAVYFLKHYENELTQGIVFSQKEIMLLEARAAKQYWRIINILCHISDWQRSRRSKDFLNTLFNVGYHYIAITIEKGVIESDLNPHIGILHANSKKNALVYDIVELYRQQIVDFVIINRLRRKGIKGYHDNGAGVVCSDIKKLLDSHIWRYKRKCYTPRTIIQRELCVLKHAMQQQKVWQPTPHLWGRSRWCKK